MGIFDGILGYIGDIMGIFDGIMGYMGILHHQAYKNMIFGFVWKWCMSSPFWTYTIPFLKIYHSFIFWHWSKNIAPGHFIPLKRLRRHVWEMFLLFSWHLLLCCKAPPKGSETSLKGTPGSPIWERYGSAEKTHRYTEAHFASEGLRFPQPSFFEKYEE